MGKSSQSSQVESVKGNFCESCESSESCPLPHLETFGLVLFRFESQIRDIDFKGVL